LVKGKNGKSEGGERNNERDIEESEISNLYTGPLFNYAAVCY
jgi:hypothetical protein